ncbi:MAG TPA: TIGR00266 family protein [Chroococcales cyanobacterium]
MQYEIQHQGFSALMRVKLDKGESFKAVSGSLVAKSSTIKMHSVAEGGAVKSLKRALLGGEKMFFLELEAKEHGEVLIAPTATGNIAVLDVQPDYELMLQGGNVLATFGEIDIETLVQQVPSGLITGEGLFVLKAKGTGAVAIGAFGDVHQLSIAPGCEFLVDHAHLLAWQGADSFTVEKASRGWISSLLSGEGLLCKFAGPTQLWLQTRNAQAFSHWVKHPTLTG